MHNLLGESSIEKISVVLKSRKNGTSDNISTLNNTIGGKKKKKGGEEGLIL